MSHPPVARPAAVDADDLRRDVAGALHAEERHLAADLLGVRPPAHGDPVGDLCTPENILSAAGGRARQPRPENGVTVI